MRRRTTRDERGSASAFVVGLTITMVVVAGLVVDGGGRLNAETTLADDAEAAAVAGAQATDVLHYRQTGEIKVDADAARTRAGDVLAGRGYHYAVQVSADRTEVSVTVTDTVPTKMLNLIGINEFSIDATARAEAEVLQP